jgi:hypothetical protein
MMVVVMIIVDDDDYYDDDDDDTMMMMMMIKIAMLNYSLLLSCQFDNTSYNFGNVCIV